MSTRIPGPPTPVLDDATLYLGDNGRCLCGRCSGASARFTGRDLSGQLVLPCDARVLREAALVGADLSCESCGRSA